MHLARAIIDGRRIADLRLALVDHGVRPGVIQRIRKRVNVHERRKGLARENVPRLPVEMPDAELHGARSRVVEEIVLVVDPQLSLLPYGTTHLDADPRGFRVD